MFEIRIPTIVFFTHGPQRWNHGSSDGLFMLLFFLLLHTSESLGAKTTFISFPGVNKVLCISFHTMNCICVCNST